MSEFVVPTHAHRRREDPVTEVFSERNQDFLHGVEIANRTLAGLRLPLIDSDAFTVLPDEVYEKTVGKEAEEIFPSDRSHDASALGLTGAVVLPGHHDVYVNQRWVEDAMEEGGSVEVGSRTAHEWSHKLASDHAREITRQDLRSLLGSARAEASLKRLRQFSPVRLQQVGVAVEVWSEDRLVEGPLNYHLSEFTADLWRFAVWRRSSDRQGLKEKARSILYGRQQKRSLSDDVPDVLPATVRDFDVSARRLMAFLYVTLLGDLSTRMTLQRVVERPDLFLDDAPPEIPRPTHRATIRALRGEIPKGQAMTALTAWKGTTKSVEAQDVSQYVCSELGL